MTGVVIPGVASVRPGAHPVRRRTPMMAAGGISRTGVLVCLLGLALAFSGLRIGRVAVGPLLVPVALPLVALGIPIVMSQLRAMPARVARAALLFSAVYFVSLRFGPSAPSQALKLASFYLTILVVALGVRTLKDFRWACASLAVGVAAMAIYGVIANGVGSGGVNPMAEVTNKNGFSLYAIPAVLAAGYLVAQRRSLWGASGIAAAATAACVAVSFMTGNRSGWFGLVLVAFLLVAPNAGTKRAMAALVLVAVAAGAAGFFAARDVVEERWTMTVNSNASDAARVKLFKAGLEVGLENPLIGVSHDVLPRMLARKIGGTSKTYRTVTGYDSVIGPHNLYGYIVGASGFLGAMAFVVLIWRVWFAAPGSTLIPGTLLRMTLVVWLFRGFFTEEVLYAPAFAICFGLGFAALRIGVDGGVGRLQRGARVRGR